MRKLTTILGGLACLFALASCEKDLEPYDTPDCRLNFLYYDYYGVNVLNTDALKNKKNYDLTNYSFYYQGNPARDTLWFKISTMGFLAPEARDIALQQITLNDTLENARPSVHYVPFDDPELAAYYRMPANQDTLSIPVILLNDPSLEKKEVVLCFGFRDNGVFKPGYSLMSSRRIVYTAMALRPAGWIDGFFGEWGPVKHQLMMEWTGEKWDGDYIRKKYDEDYSYLEYMNQWFHYKLEEENAKRVAAGEDVYREADGTEIVINIRR